VYLLENCAAPEILNLLAFPVGAEMSFANYLGDVANEAGLMI